MFDSSESLLAKLYSQALVDIDHLVSKAKETGFAYGDIDFYSRMYKRKIFNHYLLVKLIMKNWGKLLSLYLVKKENTNVTF